MLGIALLRCKLLSFGLSSFYAGVAGGLWAYFFRVVTPESFPPMMSIFSWRPSSSAAWAPSWAASCAVFADHGARAQAGVRWLTGGANSRCFSPVRTIIFGLLIIDFLVFEPGARRSAAAHSPIFFTCGPSATDAAGPLKTQEGDNHAPFPDLPTPPLLLLAAGAALATPLAHTPRRAVKTSSSAAPSP